MSLKAVEMDPYFLAGLYRQPLVGKNPEGTGRPAPIPFLGNNRRNILLLIHNGQEAYLSEPIFELLTNLLSACKLSFDDVALVNRAHLPDVDIYRALQDLNPGKVILFGDIFREIAGENPKNHLWEEDGRSFLYTDSLAAMKDDKQLKLPFWHALQSLFDL